MPTTAIDWTSDSGYDRYLLRGTRGPALRALLLFIRTDGAVEDAATYLAGNADVELDFQPSFKDLLDMTTVPPRRCEVDKPIV